MAAVPASDQMFKDLAIEVKAPKVMQFFYGDNISGYYEGYTHAFKRGAGYKMKTTPVYMDFAAWNGTNLLIRKQAQLTRVMPYGVRTIYDGGTWDEFSLYQHDYALSVRVHSDAKAKLSLMPVFALQESGTVITNIDGLLVLGPKKESKNSDYPTFVAIGSATPVDAAQADLAAFPEVTDTLKLGASIVKPIVTSKDEVTDLEVLVAFGFTRDEAVKKAQSMLKTDHLAVHKKRIYDFLTRSILWTDDADYNRALSWMKLSSYFLVVEQFGKGIWAGLPWFQDNWGRDTFISLPGTLLVTGCFDDAKSVMTNFSTFQNRGNIKVAVSYDTNDNDLKDKAKQYLKDHFGKKLSFKDDKIYCSVDPRYIQKQDELRKALDEMQAALPGVTADFTVEFDKNYGRIPNRVAGFDNIIYNTTDGTPWFLREMYEYLSYTGDTAFAKEIYPVVVTAMDGAISNYVDSNGFLTHDDADTWMDARINGGLPWSARGNRANDIQVLWYNALRVAAFMANQNSDQSNADKWNKIADNLKANFVKYFWDADQKLMADRVRKDDSKDLKVRPNQLMLISVPQFSRLLPADIEAQVLKNAVSKLLYPYGIASLSQDHPYFHPYHDGQANWNKDAAYHNGTIWGWNAGPTVTALTRFGYADFAYEFEKNLAKQVLGEYGVGCLGGMSELVDALPTKSSNIKPSGTWHQAWSSAEYSRNGFQDFGGFRPDLLNGAIVLSPSTPGAWNAYSASYAFGKGAKCNVEFARKGSTEQYTVSTSDYAAKLTLSFIATLNGAKMKVTALLGAKPVVIAVDTKAGTITVDGKSAKGDTVQKDFTASIGTLQFVEPKLLDSCMPVTEKDWLMKVVKDKKFE
jgi:glycogen debranching enzyme